MKEHSTNNNIDKFSRDYYATLENNYKELLRVNKYNDKRLNHVLRASDRQGFTLLKLTEELDEYKNELEQKVQTKTLQITQLLSSFDKYVIASKTDLKGIITYASEAYCEISGYSEEELLGQSHNIVRHPDMPKAAFKDMWKTIQSGKQWQGEVKNLKKDGSFYWVKAIVTPEYDNNNNLIEYSSIRQNITNRKKVEELSKNLEKKVEQRTQELKKLNDTLEQRVKEEVEKNISKEILLFEQSKMANMGAMIGNIAHQWRQPLSTISTASGSIALESEFETLNEKKIEKYTTAIDRNVQYLSSTIDTFRNFLKEKKERKVQVLQDRIDIALNIAGIAFKDNAISLHKNINYDSPIKLTMFTGELTEVIINILNNARDVLLEKNIPYAWVKLELKKDNNKAIISIEDNAGGIPEDIISNIFDEYFTTKDKSGGTGLGLYMSKQIITESLKGNLYVKNTCNGAKFYIELLLD